MALTAARTQDWLGPISYKGCWPDAVGLTDQGAGDDEPTLGKLKSSQARKAGLVWLATFLIARQGRKRKGGQRKSEGRKEEKNMEQEWTYQTPERSPTIPSSIQTQVHQGKGGNRREDIRKAQGGAE